MGSNVDTTRWSWGILLMFLLDLVAVAATNMEPIYWNSLNKRFSDDRGYVLYPQIGDRLDLICPASDPPGPRAPEEYEYYKLYLVTSREQADRCEVTSAPNLLLTCDKPTSDMRFTIKFQEYSPNLWGHEFKTMQDYYIIATSDGTRQGLESMRGGVCATQGMKVVLKVGQSPYGLPPKSAKPDQPGRPTNRNPGGTGNTTFPRVPGTGGAPGGENGPLPASNIAVIAGAAGGSAFLLLVTAVICVVCYRRRHSKHSESHHPPLSLSSLTSPKRGGGGGGSGNNNGSEPSDIIIPLRTSDSAYCPHYEKVSGDYGHPVYIVQEMPPQSPANIYYKV
ncbi:ephrin-B3b [Hoplias malabaricus]|uniref:ephrin-B3b n=1 Tax=Hoplias malabaricus TaxID=27720 RepID=UPI0034629441